MAKTLLHRIFGVGRIPAQLAATLANEGLLVSDEGIPGSVTYRGFRAPGKYFASKRQWFTAALALSKARLLGLQSSTKIIDVPLQDERLGRMQFSVEGDDTLVIAFDAGLFHDDWSGAIEYRFRSPKAPEFVKQLKSQRQQESAADIL